MNKKFLLSTITSAILISSNANAADFDIQYNGNNNFTYQDKVYDSFQAMSNDFYRVFNANDEIKIEDGQKRIMFMELVGNVNNLRNEFIDFTAKKHGVDKKEIMSLLDDASKTYQELPADQKFFLLNAIEINDIVKFKNKEFINTINYVKNNSVTENIIGQAGMKFTAQAKLINDANIQKLIPEMQALFAKERDRSINTTPAEKARQKELVKIIFGRDELNDLRNSSSNQELFKDYLSNLKAGAAINNKYINDVINQKTAALKSYLDVFMKTDIKDASTVPSVQKSDTAVTEGMMNSLNATRGLVDARINSFSAVSSGDLLKTYGAWVQGSMTSATQKAYKNAPGYKLSQKGVTIGADTGDENMLGIAYSYFDNEIKNKLNSANKEDIKSHHFTAYGKFILADDIFLKGQGQFGKSDIKKTRNTGDLANNLAKSKTKADIYAGKLEIGYDYSLSSPVHIIPTVGISHSDIKVKGYSETGLGLNRSISKRTTTRTSGLAGISVNYDANMDSVIKLMPEIHANIDYAFNTKNSATIVKVFNGIDPIATPAEKLAKAYLNLGASVKAFKCDRYELSAGYDLGLAKKFNSYTGTLKVRINM